MFKFRFEVLHKVRRIKSDLAQQALATAQRNLNNLLQLREECSAQIAHAGDSMLGMFTHEVKPTDLIMFYNHQRALRERLDKIHTSIADAVADVEQKREELVTATKEFKAMQRLKEIKQKEYETEQLRLENKTIDEMAITRHKVSV